MQYSGMMLSSIFATAIVFGFIVGGNTQSMNSSNLFCFVSTQGAALQFYKQLSPNQTTGNISVTFQELREMNNQTGNMTKMYALNLGGQMFNMSMSPMDMALPNSANGSTVISTSAIFSAYLPGSNASVKLLVYIANNNGTLTLGDENLTVMQSQLKFTVQISNWNWSSVSGDFLELDIGMTVPFGRNVTMTKGTGQSPKQPTKFDLGAGALAYFSTKVLVDGNWSDMSYDYPKFTQSGVNNYTVTIGLPRFNSSISYDPIFDVGNEPQSSDNGTYTNTTASPTVTTPSQGSYQSMSTVGIILCLISMLLWLE